MQLNLIHRIFVVQQVREWVIFSNIAIVNLKCFDQVRHNTSIEQSVEMYIMAMWELYIWENRRNTSVF